MWVFPLVAALVALVFAGMLGRQWLASRRAYQAVWALALLMYASGSFAMFLGVLSGWSEAEYRAYWLLGAVLNVPFLAQGEIYLLVRNRVATMLMLLLLVFVTAFAFNRIRVAVVDPAALAQDLPLGREVFAGDPFARKLASLVAYPAYSLLLVGVLWSAWKMRGVPHLRGRFVGTLLIAVGATIVAAGSAFAAAGLLAGFSLTLTAGIVAMFVGFLRASRPARPESSSIAAASDG